MLPKYCYALSTCHFLNMFLRYRAEYGIVIPFLITNQFGATRSAPRSTSSTNSVHDHAQFSLDNKRQRTEIKQQREKMYAVGRYWISVKHPNRSRGHFCFNSLKMSGKNCVRWRAYLRSYTCHVRDCHSLTRNLTIPVSRCLERQILLDIAYSSKGHSFIKLTKMFEVTESNM